jgi:hypothetical protein
VPDTSWELARDGWAGWFVLKSSFRFAGLKHTYIRKDRIEMRTGREHQCLRTPKPASLGLILASLGLILASLLTVTGWAQDSAQPPAATKPAAQGQPAAGSPPATATQPPAPGQPEVLKVSPDKVVMRVGKMEVTAGEMDAVLRSLPIAFQRAVSTQGR